MRLGSTVLTGSLSNFNAKFRPVHGPQVWPWWRLLSWRTCRLVGVQEPSKGYRLWLYTRFGAVHVDLYLDRRKP